MLNWELLPRVTPSAEVTGYMHRFTQARLLCVGDVMLDCYLSGPVVRISPEAPVPVVEIERETWMPGGMANACANAAALGATVLPVGVTGAAVPTLIGELYWIGGIWAVLAGMWCLGRFCRVCYRRLEHGADANAVFLYGLQFMFAFFVNETLSLHLSRYLFQLVVASVLLKLIQARRARSRTLRWQILTLPVPGLAHFRGTCAATTSPTGE